LKLHHELLQIRVSVHVSEDDYYPTQSVAYILDVITEFLNVTAEYYLLVQRSTWLYPLRLETGNQIYINVMYQQIRPDYIDGYLLQTPARTLQKQTQVM
jgi:hypothetical protein